MAKDSKFYGLVRDFFPSVSDKQAQSILLNWTAWPLTNDMTTLRVQLASLENSPAEQLIENEALWGEL